MHAMPDERTQCSRYAGFCPRSAATSVPLPPSCRAPGRVHVPAAAAPRQLRSHGPQQPALLLQLRLHGRHPRLQAGGPSRRRAASARGAGRLLGALPLAGGAATILRLAPLAPLALAIRVARVPLLRAVCQRVLITSGAPTGVA